MSTQGDVSMQGKAPSPPLPWFLLCFYNLWLEAVQHSILSSVAAAVVQKGSRNNCVPRWGCLNCWSKLLSPPTPHPHTCVHTFLFLPSSHQLKTIPYGGLSVRHIQEHAIYLVNNHFARHHTYRQCRVKSPGSSGASWAAPVFSFVPPLNWYCMVPQRDTGCITVRVALNHSLDRIGSRDLSQQLQFHFIRCISFH